MSEAISQASCIRHRERVKFFVMYEDFQDIAKGPHAEKIAAFLRILEVKTNEIIVANQVLAKEAKDKNTLRPAISRWIEISYSEFVRWSLGTVGRSSFQIADKEAEKLLFVKSRVLQRPSRPGDPNSSLVPYKEYVLVVENIQAALDGKELPVTGTLFEQYGEEKTRVENNIPPVLKTTAPRVENNRLEVITNKEREESGSNERENPQAADAAALTRSLLEIENLTSQEVELATRMILEQRRQQTPPPLEETAASSSIESEQKETGKNEKTAKKPTRRKTTSGGTAPSVAALALLDAMCNVAFGPDSGKEMPRTKDNLAAAEELARIGATENDLRNVRDRLLAQKDGFWKSRGVSLKNIANNFHLAALGPLPSSSNGDRKASSDRPAATEAASTTNKQPQRKLLRRVPAATQPELVGAGAGQEVRTQ